MARTMTTPHPTRAMAKAAAIDAVLVLTFMLPNSSPDIG